MDESSKVGIYIMPYRIQRQRLRDMQASMNRKNLPLSSIIDSAKFIVTEYETLDQVETQLKKDGVSAPEEACIVSLKWLIACLKASRLVDVEDCHRIKRAVSHQEAESSNKPMTMKLAEWACQRGAKLTHPNKMFSDALELLQEHAELRDANQDYSRALAFRRASCVLKSLPTLVQDVSELDNLKDIGGHARNVISDIINQGYSDEVENIKALCWYKKMKLFTGIFGVGPATGKKWIDKGWENIEDVIKARNFGSDVRISWGLAFFTDLNSHVALHEANSFLHVVREEAENILPGVIVTLVGGFRRGKTFGHDVDILLSHPSEGQEIGLLIRLLKSLQGRDLLLYGHKEKNSFRPEALYQDFKLSMRGQLDHFEKWIGICKFPNAFQKKTVHASPNSSYERVKCASVSDNDQEIKSLKQNQNFSGKCLSDSMESDSYEPVHKKAKPETHTIDQLIEISRDPRDWTARRVDLIVCPYSQYYYALVGWTGSKHFNRDARLYAQKNLGMKLTSHGLFDSKQQKSLPAESEEEVFHHLNIPCRPPCERNC